MPSCTVDATVSGSLKDPNGQGIPDAPIEIHIYEYNPSTGSTVAEKDRATASTDSNGNYSYTSKGLVIGDGNKIYVEAKYDGSKKWKPASASTTSEWTCTTST